MVGAALGVVQANASCMGDIPARRRTKPRVSGTVSSTDVTCSDPTHDPVDVAVMRAAVPVAFLIALRARPAVSVGLSVVVLHIAVLKIVALILVVLSDVTLVRLYGCMLMVCNLLLRSRGLMWTR